MAILEFAACQMFSRRRVSHTLYRSVKTGPYSRIGFYQAVTFQATPERAGWVLANTVSAYCPACAVALICCISINDDCFAASGRAQALGG